MKLITETVLRSEINNKLIKEYIIDKYTIITPAARQYLMEKNVKIIIQEEGMKLQHKHTDERKPEFMTHLHKDKLVYKDDLRIAFRGKLDSLQGSILEMQVLTDGKRLDRLTKDLEDILNYCRQILRAEVLNEDFKIWNVIGLEEAQVREIGRAHV